MAALVARHAMLFGVRRLGVAVSGGADSVALLRLLLPLCRAAGVTPVVLHFDHGLRGAASAAEARFVAKLAKRLKVECELGYAGMAAAVEDEDDIRGRRTVLPPATKNQERRTRNQEAPTQSLEMAARTARQEFFRDAEKKRRLDAIATGHTADDVAETLLLRLARGSGATGLSGLRPVHTVTGVKYVRPLLDCAHGELRAWLRRRRQAWREDASNRDERIPRNRLRHTVIPWLERNWSPSIRAMLVQSASILRDEDALLVELARLELNRVSSLSDFPTVRLSDGLPRALQRRVLRQWLLDAGCAEAAGWNEVESILAHIRERATWQVSLPGGVSVRAEGGRLQLVESTQHCSRGRWSRAAPSGHGYREVKTASATLELPVPGGVEVAGVCVTAQRARGIVRTPGPVGVLPSSCSLDAAALRGKTLLVRTRRPGDRIQPLGLDGSKTLQDLFVDAKVPAAQRDQLPLLVVEDEVVWVPGYRVARKYAVQAPRAASVRVDVKGMGH